MDTVSHVILERLALPAGLDRMLGWSAVAHVALLATIALVPAGWLGARALNEPESLITIQIAAPVGARDGGMTALPARPVQQQRDAEIKKTIEEVRPPATAQPEMVEPVRTMPTKREALVTTTVKEPASRTPIEGERMQNGSAVADTKSESTESGLTFGGNGTGARLDVADFCCPEYVAVMQELISRNWNSMQQGAGVTVMKFTIQRDGRLMDIVREKSSGQPSLDFLSERALLLTKLPPLPAAYTQSALTVHISFEYYRRE